MQTVQQTEQDLASRIGQLTAFTNQLDEGMLVSAEYDGQAKAIVLKLYDPKTQTIRLWKDSTGHLPFCYSKADRRALADVTTRFDIDHIEDEEKIDLLTDTRIRVRKIVAKNPLAIGGGGSVSDQVDCWESDIKYYQCYIYDKSLVTGHFYTVQRGMLKLLPKEMAPEVKHSLEEMSAKNSYQKQFLEFVNEWARVLGQPLCDFKRIACDIEVANDVDRLPDPVRAEKPVISVSFYNKTEKLVYQLKGASGEMPGGAMLTVFPDEPSLLRATFRKMLDYPFLLTFNGDDFDLSYLFNRALKLGLKNDEIPIEQHRFEMGLKHGVHLDLYRWFFNHSVKVYVYNNKYDENTLESISQAVLGRGKIDLEETMVGDLTPEKLAEYCLNDSQLTYDLTAYANDQMMKVMTIFSRIAKTPMNDICRLGISNWIQNMLYNEHRKIGALIPKKEELTQKGTASSEAIIKGKKYKGGLVIEPTPGVFFSVSVLDFASLYPTVIKVHNLSYETVNCPHEDCKVSNRVPETEHWTCSKRNGLFSLTIGSLRDLRVYHYKHLSKDKRLSLEERDLNAVIASGVKVILNASYGVEGYEKFALFCLPVADCTTALGRDKISRTIDKAKSLDLRITASDTDSMFVPKPDPEKAKELIQWAEDELDVELEVDKQYRWVAFSDRKKNYFGIFTDGTADIKGLTGKKRHTPPCLKKPFYDTIDLLKNINGPRDFDEAKATIKQMLTESMNQIRDKAPPLTLKDYAFRMQLGENIDTYGKDTIDEETGETKKGSTPQHAKAAKMLQDAGKVVGAGSFISFIKTRGADGVKPLQLAKMSDVDTSKYLDFAQSMFEQVLDPLDINFEEILGASTMDQFWS